MLLHRRPLVDVGFIHQHQVGRMWLPLSGAIDARLLGRDHRHLNRLVKIRLVVRRPHSALNARLSQAANSLLQQHPSIREQQAFPAVLRHPFDQTPHNPRLSPARGRGDADSPLPLLHQADCVLNRFRLVRPVAHSHISLMRPSNAPEASKNASCSRRIDSPCDAKSLAMSFTSEST